MGLGFVRKSKRKRRTLAGMFGDAPRLMRESFHDLFHPLWVLKQNIKARMGTLTPPPDPKEVTAETYGSPVPLNYGAFRHKCDVIWSTSITPHFPDPNNENVGGGTDNPEDALWSASFACKIAEGQQGELLRVWFNGDLAYQANEQGATTYPNIQGNVRFYNGSETQTADPAIVADKGAANAPPYRGICYIVFSDLPLKRYGDELPTVEVEITGAATEDFTTYTTAITAPLAADTDNFIVSRNTNMLYALSNTGTLAIVQREGNTLTAELELNNVVNAATGFDVSANGRLCIEEGATGFFGLLEPIYLFCNDGGGNSFIFKFANEYVNNAATKITGEETSGYVVGDRLYTADGQEGKIHCYNKNTLNRLWSRKGPTTGVEAGNFTHDNAGRVWLTWYDGGDPDTVHFSSITHGGNVKNTSVVLSNGGARGIAYDSHNNRLVTGGGGGKRLAFWDITTQTPTLTGNQSNAAGNHTRALFVAQHRFKKALWSIETDIAYKWNTGTGLLRESIDLSNYFAQNGGEGWGYSATDNAFYAVDDAAPTLRKVPIHRFTNDAPGVGAVIGDLVERCGYSASNYDVVDLASADNVEGYAVPDRTTAAPALQELLDAYQIVAREHYASTYGGHLKIEFVRRSTTAATIVVSIPSADLGMGEGAPDDNPIAEDHTDEEDLPKIVTVRYADRFRDYSTQTQQATLPASVVPGLTEYGIDCTNVVLTAAQAVRLAENTQRALWVEGEIKHFNLGLKYLYLEPEDHVTVNLPSGWSATVRLETVELGANLIVSCSGVVTSADLWVNTSPGVAADDTPGVIVSIPPSRPFLLDLPACRDVDGLPQDGGFYGGVAPVGAADNWNGAALVRSVAGGLSYETCGGFNAGVNYGLTTEALADASDCTTFHTADQVAFTKGYGSSWADATEAQLYQDRTRNLCAVGSISRGYELIQFQNYTDNGDGTAIVSGLLRGQFGTERLSTAHTSGEEIVLLDFVTPTIKRVVLPVADRGTVHKYKAVSAGLPLSTAPAVQFTNDCASLKPYQATHVVGELNTPAADDITVNWFHRSRLGFDLIDEYDIAINEETHRYEIVIRENSADDPIVRTVSLSLADVAVSNGLVLSVAAGLLHVVAASFISMGFVKGMYIDIGGDGLPGFVNAANNGRFLITAITASDLTLEGITTLVNEAAPATTPSCVAVTPGFRYTAAQQTTDFGTPKGNAYFEIYQMSDTLEDNSTSGRGFGYIDVLP